ncbi:serine aminopeptidase domain-containing protein [Streptomyces sp. Tue6028]|uniref:alpha/beta hydrolase n=1 Tax=Streptomyces sp. Tue6028 TaxID=2036037 RepID=UPI003EB8A887
MPLSGHRLGRLWEVGQRCADNDIAFFFLDRRGSGISGGDRRDVPDVDTIVGDCANAVAHVRRWIGDDAPPSLFGHCLGGSFLSPAAPPRLHRPARGRALPLDLAGPTARGARRGGAGRAGRGPEPGASPTRPAPRGTPATPSATTSPTSDASSGTRAISRTRSSATRAWPPGSSWGRRRGRSPPR